ncbi:MAG: hypothetical protein OJF49_003856 [Ktedonobacterales bacterium]|jgi:lysophospholipase L1-like esterase|nr:MAG: hypothetical protein OJF49_003856 [Ktedonobacterales bacterium]
MGHVALLGDSIFDNHAYIAPDEPPVIAQVRERLPHDWKATLLAVDGSVMSDVPGQLARMPDDASHIVVSVGGNDALEHTDMLAESARSVAEVFERVSALGEAFEVEYRRMVEAVLRRRLPVALCTIYYPAFPDPGIQRLAVAGLTAFNDVILRVAGEAGLPVLDLRLICTTPADYANPIEPSAQGGAKIAEVIGTVVTEHDFTKARTAIFIYRRAG